jgi:hypothetical protein
MWEGSVAEQWSQGVPVSQEHLTDVFSFLFLLTQGLSIAQAVLELMILLPQPPSCCGYRPVSPCPAKILESNVFKFSLKM